MSLEIECSKCRKRFWISGYSSPDTWYEPGEVVIPESETFDKCCECVKQGGPFDVTDEEWDHFDDDVI